MQCEWDTATGKLLRQVGPAESYERGTHRDIRIGVSPFGQTLVVFDMDKRLRFFDRTTGETAQSRADFARPIQSLTITPDSRQLWTQASDVVAKGAGISQAALETGSIKPRPMTSNKYSKVLPSPDGRYFAHWVAAPA